MWDLATDPRPGNSGKIPAIEWLVREGHPLVGIEIENSFLSGLVAPRGIFQRANFSDSNLSDAALLGANLSDAILSVANLSGANLFGANLTGAYLWGANLSDADLRSAYYCKDNSPSNWPERAPKLEERDC